MRWQTSYCRLQKNTRPKCVNCLENHPANYRGCLVAKELQKRRNASKNLGNNKSVDKPTSVKTVPLQNNEISRPNTYASVAKKAETSSKPKSRDTSDVLSQILEKLNQQEKVNKQLEKKVS